VCRRRQEEQEILGIKSRRGFPRDARTRGKAPDGYRGKGEERTPERAGLKEKTKGKFRPQAKRGTRSREIKEKKAVIAARP
jgi:hypothetical protein